MWPQANRLYTRPLHLVATSAVLCLALVSCDKPIRFKNAVPAVGSVGPAGVEGDELALWLSLVDVDEDPVDVFVELSIDGAPFAPLDATPGKGHGLAGLTTDAAYPGRLHIVVLDAAGALDGAPSGATARLRLTADDGVAGEGPAAVSPPFPLSEGLAEPVEVELLPLAN